MILHLCAELNAARFEGNPYVHIESRILDCSLRRFAQQGSTNLDHCHRLLIDLNAVPDGEDEIRQAIRALREMYALEIAVLADGAGEDCTLRASLWAWGCAWLSGDPGDVTRRAVDWALGAALWDAAMQETASPAGDFPSGQGKLDEVRSAEAGHMAGRRVRNGVFFIAAALLAVLAFLGAVTLLFEPTRAALLWVLRSVLGG